MPHGIQDAPAIDVEDAAIFGFGCLIEWACPFAAGVLNATSRRPYLPTVKSTMAFTSASLATSARTNAASPPSFLISLTTCAPSFSRRPVRTTLAPARANAIAVVLPMPEVPPVTSALFPHIFPSFILFLSFCGCHLFAVTIWVETRELSIYLVVGIFEDSSG